MTRFATLPPDVRDAICRVCTPAEQDTLHYYELGYGSRRIARVLNVNRDTVRSRIDSAVRKVEKEIGYVPFAGPPAA